MTVIGYNQTTENRARLWNDLLEAKRSYLYYGSICKPQEKRIAEIDREFYATTLSKYVA